MKRFNGVSTRLALLLAVACLAMAGCAGAQPDSSPSCVPADKLEKTVAPEAKLMEFSCFFKEWKGAEVLHFKVKIQNASDQPQRYRVNIFLDNDKAVGGLIPRKTKNGLVKPGESAEFVYPVRGMSEKPGGVDLIIRTMAP